MFCPKCGNSLPDDAAFCGACGTQLASATPVQKPKVQVKKSWIAIGAAVLVVALVVVLCVTLIGGNSAKGVLEKYLDGVTGFDGAAIWENASVRVHGCDTKEECVAEQKEMKTQMESYSSMLGGMKTTYKITEETPVSLSSLSSSMVSSIEAERAATVTEAVEFTVEVSVSIGSSSAMNQTQTMSMLVVKVGDMWLVADEDY